MDIRNKKDLEFTYGLPKDILSKGQNTAAFFLG